MNFVTNARKIIQRRSYDFLSQKYSFLLITLVSLLLLTAIIQFGEVWLKWSKEKYEVAFNPYSDNIIQKSLQNKLCQYVPIDVVYTWVNGSDLLLLNQLRDYEDQLLEEKSGSCPYLNCVPSHIVIAKFPEDPKQRLWSTKVLSNSPMENHKLNSTVMYFSTPEEASEAVMQTMMVKKANISLHQTHWTTDKLAPFTYLIPNTLIISSIQYNDVNLVENNIRITFQNFLNDNVTNIWTYPGKGIAVVELAAVDLANALIEKFGGHLVLEGNTLAINYAYLVTEVPFGEPENFAPSRFEDKEELRYSLRSLEKFAPWVRHIYIVTNGQIPHWLNLDNPRLTLVTHEEIFSELSHLPTFSSPAIETHIHRIPGLSDKFLYFNDDVLLGKEVWPDDFITHSKGQKVYFSWSVPDCSELCPWSYISDGSCDVACNNSDCFFDGGDCNLTEDNAANNFGMAMYDENNQNVDAFTDDPFDSQFNLGNNDNNPFKHLVFYEDSEKKMSKEDESAAEINSTLVNYLLDEKNTGVSEIEDEPETPFDKGLANILGQHTLTSKRKSDSYPSIQSSTRPSNISFNSTFVVNAMKGLHPSNITHLLNLKNMSEEFHSEMKRQGILGDTEYKQPNSNQTHIQLFRRLKSIGENSRNIHKARRQSYLRKRVKYLMKHDWKNFVKKHRLNRNYTDKQRKSFKGQTNHGSSLETIREDEGQDKTFNLYSSQYKPADKSKMKRKDTFAESLLYVNRIYNKEFGFEVRKVPAHMPHLIDRKIMEELQNRFKNEWNITSSHKTRSSNDMQYAFSYFYFLMSEKNLVSVSDIFDIFDTDKSGTWSDREIRTLLTKLHQLPLSYSHVTAFAEKIINCSKSLPKEISQLNFFTPMYERYQDSKLPVVSRTLVENCEFLKKLLLSKFGSVKKYKYEIVKEKHKLVTFKMLNSNITQVITVLDEVRKEPKKFICLNDNLNPIHERDNTLIRAILLDFYEAFLPARSSFELPPEYRNRFLHISELEVWRANRNVARIFVYICLAVLFTFSLSSFIFVERQVRQRRTVINGNSGRQYVNVNVDV